MNILIGFQAAALLYLLVTAPPIASQLMRAVVHDRGWNISLTDTIAAACALFLWLVGLPVIA